MYLIVYFVETVLELKIKLSSLFDRGCCACGCVCVWFCRSDEMCIALAWCL